MTRWSACTGTCTATGESRAVDLDPQPLAAAPAGPPQALCTLDGLLAAIETDPPPALAAGGLGARPIKTIAKSLGQPVGAVGMLAILATRLHLITETAIQAGHATGRGRTLRYVGEQRGWRTTGLAERWCAAPVAQQWARVVQAWRDSTGFSESDGLPEKVAALDHETQQASRLAPEVRGAVLDVLLGLPEGMGTSASALAQAADFARPSLLLSRRVGGEVAALRALGLVPGEGPVGLNAAARALLVEGPGAVEALLPPPRRAVTVQADRTVIAPPDLASDLVSRLAPYGEWEADAVVRLSEARMSAALDAANPSRGSSRSCPSIRPPRCPSPSAIGWTTSGGGTGGCGRAVRPPICAATTRRWSLGRWRSRRPGCAPWRRPSR